MQGSSPAFFGSSGLVKDQADVLYGAKSTVTSQGNSIVNLQATSKMVLLGKLTGADFNTTGDNIIPMSTSSSYIINWVFVTNASVNMTTAVGGVYTAASKGGSAFVAANTTYTGLTSAAKWKSCSLAAPATTDVLTGGFVYLSLTTPQGVAATADVYIFGWKLD